MTLVWVRLPDEGRDAGPAAHGEDDDGGGARQTIGAADASHSKRALQHSALGFRISAMGIVMEANPLYD